MGARNNKSDKAKDTATGKFSGSPSSKNLADVQNKQGTKYAGNLQKAIAAANERHRARSLAGRKEAAARAAIQAQEAKQVSPTASGIEGMVSRMDKEREGLRKLARRNRITNTQLNRLGALNEAIGLNRTTGMGAIESLRDQFTKPEFKQGIGNLVKAYQKISPMGLLMRNILNPQFEEETGIQSLPEFKGLQRTNQMFGPGVYDFTRPTGMPMNMAEATPDQRGFFKGLLDRFINPSIMEKSIDPGLEQQDKKRDIIEQMREEIEAASMPMQFADASRSDINTVLSPMFKGMDRDMIETLGGTFSPEFTDQDFEDIREGIITSPTGIYSAQI